MITGVPNHQQLRDTAIGWLRLAWDNTIRCLKELDEHSDYLKTAFEDMQDDKRARYLEKVVLGQRFMLNNAVTLLQQSLELYLKSVIAETSPFLLVAGDPQTWPKPNSSGVVDFSNFRTIDAVHLCRAANTAGSKRLPPKFEQFYDERRKLRNTIAHLDTGAISTESTRLLTSILEAHSLMFEGQRWQVFRRQHDAQGQLLGDDDQIYEIDNSYDRYLSEVEVLIDRLAPKDLKNYLGYVRRKRNLSCRVCWNMTTKYYDGDHRYVQKQDDGSFLYITCVTVFADQETYEKAGELL